MKFFNVNDDTQHLQCKKAFKFSRKTFAAAHAWKCRLRLDRISLPPLHLFCLFPFLSQTRGQSPAMSHWHRHIGNGAGLCVHRLNSTYHTARHVAQVPSALVFRKCNKFKLQESNRNIAAVPPLASLHLSLTFRLLACVYRWTRFYRCGERYENVEVWPARCPCAPLWSARTNATT